MEVLVVQVVTMLWMKYRREIYKEPFFLCICLVLLSQCTHRLSIEKEVRALAKKTKMTPEAAARIQAHADRTGTNQDFKARAQSAAAKKKK